jgi:hypothetical protein
MDEEVLWIILQREIGLLLDKINQITAEEMSVRGDSRLP